MTNFPLRLIVNFLVSIVIGILLLPILDNVPMLNDAAIANEPTNIGCFLLVFLSIIALGVADGWFNQTTNQAFRVKCTAWSYIVASSGAVIGVLWAAWPFSDNHFGVLVGQAIAVFFDFLIFFFLPHIGGQDTWEKHQARLIGTVRAT